MKKRYLAICLVLVLALGLAACNDDNSGSSTDTNDAGASGNSDYEIGVVVKTLGNPFFKEISYGAIEMGETLGVKINAKATAKEGEIEEQISICEDLLAGGIDALVVTPQHSEGIAPAVTQAQSQGVPFIAVDTNVNGVDVESYIGMDNVEAGYIIGKLVCEKMGGKGKMVILQGMAGASTSEERTEGYVKAVAEYPNIEIVASQNANFEQDTAQQVMSDILQANSNIDGVLSCGDLMALGAIISLEEQGYTIGGDDGVVIGAYDISVAALESVQNGELYVAGYHWGKLYGAWGVELAVRALNGEEIPARVTSPHSEITKDNVDGFLTFAKMLEKVSIG